MDIIMKKSLLLELKVMSNFLQNHPFVQQFSINFFDQQKPQLVKFRLFQKYKIEGKQNISPMQNQGVLIFPQSQYVGRLRMNLIDQPMGVPEWPSFVQGNILFTLHYFALDSTFRNIYENLRHKKIIQKIRLQCVSYCQKSQQALHLSSSHYIFTTNIS